jgi:hypothetical protein
VSAEEERCVLSDLLKSQCAHCRPGTVLSEYVPGELGPWFTARFDSSCDGCASRIHEGDTIRADGEGGYLCQSCGTQSR